MNFSYVQLDSPICAVLVVEKEAVYRQLCGSPLFQTSITTMPKSISEKKERQDSNYLESLVVNRDSTANGYYSTRVLDKFPIPGSVLLVTGKGFPDLACRHFLACLSSSHPSIPLFALVDSDPHGIAIFMNYKYATQTQFKNGTAYPVSKIEYLGVSLSDYGRINPSSKNETQDKVCLSTDPTTSWIQMLHADYKKGMSILRDPWFLDPSNKHILREIQMGLFLGKKAEMNTVVSNSPDFTEHDDSQKTLLDTGPSTIAEYAYYKLSSILLNHNSQ